MNLATPFTPTAEELEWYRRNCAPREFPEDSALPATATVPAITPATAPAVTPSHTQSTAPVATRTYPGSALTAPVPGLRPPRPSLAPCVIRAADFKHLKIKRRLALMDTWLCEGDLGYIFAPRGAGKTWMAMALPIAISRGQPLGHWAAGADAFRMCASAPADDPAADPEAPLPYIPVLYVDGEMAQEKIQERSDGLELELSGVDILHHETVFNHHGDSLNIGDPGDRECLTNLLLEFGYKILILDNLSSLASGIDENKGMDYEPIANWLLDLRRRQITVIIVHHAGRNGCMRGHSKREDACAWIMELRDVRQEGDPGAKFVSHFSKPSRNTGEPMPDLLWHFTTGKDGKTKIHCETMQATEYQQFIQHVLDGVTRQGDLAEMMDKNRGTISKWANRALQEGLISGSQGKLLPPKKHPSKVKAYAYADDDDADESGDEGDAG
jgi:AAA domain